MLSVNTLIFFVHKSKKKLDFRALANYTAHKNGYKNGQKDDTRL